MCRQKNGLEPNLALEMGVPLEQIKIHGHWKSDAIWSYLTSTSKSGALVASTFNKNVC